jgi:transcription antitermination factor NusG
MSGGKVADMSDKGPGRPVKIIDGTFAGMTGELLTLAQARVYWQEYGGEEPYSKEWPGIICVLMTIHGRPLVVNLEAWQVTPAT